MRPNKASVPELTSLLMLAASNDSVRRAVITSNDFDFLMVYASANLQQTCPCHSTILKQETELLINLN